ncbi:MAG: tRNA (5-methylaminomethyl-2-thiouridylate)-methyltransferase [Rhodocyclales bacterium]|nr:tRNA (5-methylaminomethyl-2-thiouridylate)-methyltransferase [Rhodocyclales bacterium]
MSGEGMKVVVGMSGGVDSSVAALLLKQQGYAVTGLFMKNWEDDDDDEYCSTRQDLVDVASVCDVIGIDLEVVNFSKEYKDRVFADFLREYEAGRTPNPDILCNSEIKFKAFLDHAMQLGADKIATGHYASVREWTSDGRSEFQLLKADDGTKDQSYFLYRLNQAQLSKTLFPLGNIYKRDVRAIAERAGIHVHDKKDSTGICFIGERPFREFLMRYLPTKPGEIRAFDDNRIIGEHQGLMYHTIGQRKGLLIGGIKGNDNSGDHEAWYVAGKDMQANVLYAVQGHEHPALQRERLKAIDLNWIAGRAPRTNWVYTAKPRYRTPDAPCEIDALSDSEVEIAFAAPQWALTPGQSVVVYESRVCLGGGIII